MGYRLTHRDLRQHEDATASGRVTRDPASAEISPLRRRAEACRCDAALTRGAGGCRACGRLARHERSLVAGNKVRSQAAGRPIIPTEIETLSRACLPRQLVGHVHDERGDGRDPGRVAGSRDVPCGPERDRKNLGGSDQPPRDGLRNRLAHWDALVGFPTGPST